MEGTPRTSIGQYLMTLAHTDPLTKHLAHPKDAMHHAGLSQVDQDLIMSHNPHDVEVLRQKIVNELGVDAKIALIIHP
jgi:hypothetical protein